MLSMTLSTVSESSPSSRMTELPSPTGLAPITEMSLTVPETAILPMSPPGKNRGLTVWPSMVNTMSFTTAESSRASRGISVFILGKWLVICLEMNSCMMSPPAPSFMMTLDMDSECIPSDKKGRYRGLQISSQGLVR